MPDIFSPQKRSAIMSAVRCKDTTPELLVRKALHSFGYRFRLHQKELAGKPDITLKKYRVAVFVNGCFWHGHDCKKGNLPKTNTEFWHQKISANVERDSRNIAVLTEAGWEVFVIWECRVKENLSGLFDYLERRKRLLAKDLSDPGN